MEPTSAPPRKTALKIGRYGRDGVRNISLGVEKTKDMKDHTYRRQNMISMKNSNLYDCPNKPLVKRFS